MGTTGSPTVSVGGTQTSPSTAGLAVLVRGLERSYGDVKAVRGVDLAVARGEVFAFLGPNGAGKTTTVEILAGYRHRDAGKVSVLGVDPARADRAWRARIGIVCQETALDEYLTVGETLSMFARYYPSPRPLGELLAMCGLSDLAKRRVGVLSGGQRRRLDVAVALVGRPELLFLDEPTTGFDVAARRTAWDLIRQLRDAGTTIFLTTHNLEEAEALADRVAVIVGGRIVGEGKPSELATLMGRYRISFTIDRPGETPPVGRPDADGRWSLATEDPREPLKCLVDWALAAGVELADLEVRRPTLEEIYLALTGAATAGDQRSPARAEEHAS